MTISKERLSIWIRSGLLCAAVAMTISAMAAPANPRPERLSQSETAELLHLPAYHSTMAVGDVLRANGLRCVPLSHGTWIKAQGPEGESAGPSQRAAMFAVEPRPGVAVPRHAYALLLLSSDGAAVPVLLDFSTMNSEGIKLQLLGTDFARNLDSGGVTPIAPFSPRLGVINRAEDWNSFVGCVESSFAMWAAEQGLDPELVSEEFACWGVCAGISSPLDPVCLACFGPSAAQVSWIVLECMATDL